MTKTEPEAPLSRRRTLLLFGGAAVVFILVIVFGAPLVLSSFVERGVEQALSDALGGSAELESVSLSFFGGLQIGAGSLRTARGEVDVSWRSIETDATLQDILAAAGSGHLGDRVVVDGLKLRLIVSGGPLRSVGEVPPRRIALPEIELRDAELILQRDDGRIHLEHLSMRTSPTVLHVSGAGGAASRLEQILEIQIGSRLRVRSGEEELTGALDLRSRVSPATAGITASLLLALSGLELRWSGGGPAEEESMAFEGGTFDLDLDETSITSEEVSRGRFEPIVRRLRGAVRAKLATLRIGGTGLDDVAMQGTLTDGEASLALPPTSLNGGTLEGEGVLGLLDGGWRTRTRLREVMTSPELIYLLARVCPVFVLAQENPSATRCRVRSSFDLDGGPDRDVRGTGSLEVSAGTVPVPRELGPLIAMVTDGEVSGLQFEPFSQSLRLEGGKFTGPTFRWIANRTVIDIDGSTTLGGELSHAFRISSSRTPDSVPEQWRHALKSLETQPIRLEGSVTDPQLRLPMVLHFLGFGRALLKPPEIEPARD